MQGDQVFPCHIICLGVPLVPPLLKSNTVKPAVAATSIKRDPPLSGHFRPPRTILNANAPLLSVHLSNAASGQRNSPQNAEILSSNGQFLCVDAASFD